jgi:hypothetical protein
MEPYKMSVTVRMMDGTSSTFLVNRHKSVMRIWRALGKIWDLDTETTDHTNGSER